LDSVFCTSGGDFRNEIYWYYYNKMHDSRKKMFARATDTIFFYVKDIGTDFVFHQTKEKRDQPVKQLARKKVNGKMVNAKDENGHVIYNIKDDRTVDNVWRIPCLQPASQERLGYPTQKPEALLERIIQSSSNEGDIILDAYCGCGTTVAVSQKLNRQWIGIDITYQSISLIIKRLGDSYGLDALKTVNLSGIPKDVKSAEELALKKDDRLRKEFEKWAVLTYSKNQAAINHKKGADQGIDGIGFFPISDKDFGRIIFQVKSGKVSSKDIRDLHGTIAREKAELGFFVTLQSPTKDMVKEAKACSSYHHVLMNKDIPKIQIVTIQEILEQGRRLDLSLVAGVLKSSPRHTDGEQLDLLVG